MSDSTPTSSVGPDHSVFAAVARWFDTRAPGVAGERDDGIDWLRVPPFIAMQLAREDGDTLDWILADITYTPWDQRYGVTLEQASFRKLESNCRKLAFGPDDHVVEIGTGSGGFAIPDVTAVASPRRRCRSPARADARAHRRRRPHGPHHRAAGGLSRSSRPVRQARIDRDDRSHRRRASAAPLRATVAGAEAGRLGAGAGDHHRGPPLPRALREVDFIKRHVFPGSFIPSTSAMRDAMGRHTGLALLHLEDIGASYARTLSEWRRRFECARERVLTLGYDERFIRLWRFYLCYCEDGFLERSIGNVQMLFARPGYRNHGAVGA